MNKYLDISINTIYIKKVMVIMLKYALMAQNRQAQERIVCFLVINVRIDLFAIMPQVFWLKILVPHKFV